MSPSKDYDGVMPKEVPLHFPEENHLRNTETMNDVTKNAKSATDKEHRMTLLQGIRLYPKAVAWSILISTCICMEGFDVCLLSNFYAFPQFNQKYGERLPDGSYQVPARWQAGLSNGANCGEIIGLFLNGWISERFGYRYTVMGCLTLIIGFTAIFFTAQSVIDLQVAEILCGIPWGVFQTLTITYASEVCPVALRGYLTTYVNFCWGLGQVIGIGVIKAMLPRKDEWAYRIPYALQWMWPVPLLIGIFLAPESPWWLVRKGRTEDAKKSLLRLTSTNRETDFDADETVSMMVHTTALEEKITKGASYLDCFKGTDRRRTEIVCMVWAIQNLSGNSFSGYSTYFLEQAGLPIATSYDFALGQYSINCVGVFGAWFLMSLGIGRRSLYLYGLCGLCTMLFIMGFLGLPSNRDTASVATGSIMLVWALCYQLTVGTVCYSLVAELSTRRLQIKTVVLGRNLYNVVGIICSVLTPYMLNPGAWNWGNYTGFFWAAICFCCIIYTYFRVPEPSGRSFAELDLLFERRISARKFASTNVDVFDETLDGSLINEYERKLSVQYVEERRPSENGFSQKHDENSAVDGTSDEPELVPEVGLYCFGPFMHRQIHPRHSFYTDAPFASYCDLSGPLILPAISAALSAFTKMASLLRRPNLARQSTSLAECVFCSQRRLTAISRTTRPRQFTSSLPRYYATVNPGSPKKPKKDTKKNADEDADKVAEPVSKEPDKTPPGFEETYNKESKSSPLAGQSGASSSSESLNPGFKSLTEEELKQVNDVAQIIKNGLPESQKQAVDAAVDMIKKGGIPEELREVLDARKADPGQHINLSTTVKLVSLFTKLSRMTPEELQAKYSAGREKKANSEKDEIPRFDQSNEGQSKGRQKNQQKGPDPSKIKIGEFKLDTSTFLITAFLSYYIYRSLFPGESSRDITWQEFRTTFFDKGLVDKLTVINRNKVRVELHREAVANMYPESPAVRPTFYYYFSIGSVEAFERRLDEAHEELGIPSNERIPVAYADEVPITAALISFGPTLLLVGALVWLSRRAGSAGGGQSGIFGIGKSRAKKFNHETDVTTKFSDVAGMDEAKVEIMEFVSFLKDPGRFQKLGAKIPRGAILSGPPGTGKTLLAKATAGESGVPFFSVSGSEFVEMFVGVGPSRVRDLFANARKSTPCIIFIDEIDAIGKSRAKQNFGGGNDERESTLNQILTEMDGFNTTEQVVVLAGTNRPDVLDKALMRPGRFDRHISIDRPTMDGRKQIFLVHLKKIVTSVDMEYLTGRLSALTPGFSGADIANCVNEAALIAARANANTVGMEHFEQAIERVIGGLEKKSLVLTPEEKKTVAYHEAGHAICGWFFKYADPLLKVSIIPRGQGALGYAQYLPAGGGDVYLMNVKQLMDRMAMTLGGRVSEEIWFDTVTSGASDDFNKVTRMATAMVTEWGMSDKIGYLNYKDDEQRLHKPFSEETARNIDSEVRRIVDEAYKQCKDLLMEKKDQVQLVAEELLKKEMLVRDDLVRLLGARPFEEKGEFSKYFDNREPSGAGKSAPPPPPHEGMEPGAGPEVPMPAFKRID